MSPDADLEAEAYESGSGGLVVQTVGRIDEWIECSEPMDAVDMTPEEGRWGRVATELEESG